MWILGKRILVNINKVDTIYAAEDITGDYFIICAKINNTDIHLARVNTEEEATNFLKRLYKTLGGGVDVRDYQPTGN